MSIYVQYHSGAFPVLAEGQVCPLLKKKDAGNPSDTEYEWAFAITKVTGTSGSPDNNGLLAALLQAIGFQWDPDSDYQGSPAVDFFYVDTSVSVTDRLLDSFDVSSLFSNFASLGDITFAVTVSDPGGGDVFHLDGTPNPRLPLSRNRTYIFDQSDPSNSGHQLGFRTESDVAYTDGVTSTGTPGTLGALTTFNVPNDAPDDLKYYCITHDDNGEGNSITVSTIVAPPADLVLAQDAQRIPINAGKQFGVSPFQFVPTSLFSLGADGDVAIPGFSLAIQLQPVPRTAVTVAGSSGSDVFHLNGQANPALELLRGHTYVFDQSDATNTGHRLGFRDPSDTAYTAGVTHFKTPGSAGAATIFDVPGDAPDDLKYYCITDSDNGKGNSISVSQPAQFPAWRDITSLAGDVALAIDAMSADRIVFEHTGGVGGPIRANGVRAHELGNPVLGELKANNDTLNPKDNTRKTRLSISNGALGVERTDTAGSEAPKMLLAVELFASVRFDPIDGLPLQITVASDLISARFQRKRINETASDFDVRIRPGQLCVKITISGPMIQFGADASDWLTLVEPAEKYAKEIVEEVNDYLTYTFEVCLPPLPFTDPQWDNIIEKIDLPWLSWEFDVPRLDQLVLRIQDILANIPNLDFDVGFPDVGRIPDFPGFKLDNIGFERIPDPDFPDVEFPRLKIDKLFPGIGNIELPKVPGLNKPDVQPDFGQLKLKMRYAIELPRLEAIDYDALELTFVARLPSPLTLDALEVGDLLEIYFGDVRLPDLSIVEFSELSGTPIKLKLKLNAKLLKPDGLRFRAPDFPSLSTRWKRPSLDYMRRIKFLKPISAISYQIYLEGPEFPNIGTDFEIPNIGRVDPKFLLIDISTDVSFSLIQSFLKDLLGDIPGVDFRMTMPDIDFQKLRLSFRDLLLPEPGHMKLPIPFELSLRLPRPDVELPQAPKLRFWISIGIDPMTLRLVSNRIYFFLPQVEQNPDPTRPPVTQQAVDFEIFTQSFPMRTEITGPPTEDDHDGYLDLSDRELVIDLKYPDGQEPDPPPRIQAFFPGGMDERAVERGLDGIESLPEDNARMKAEKRRLQREYTRRFRLELNELAPAVWPEESGGGGLYFRLNPKGITFNALLVKTEVEIDTSGHEEGQQEDVGGLINPFKVNPQDKQGELVSRLVLIDTEMREATVFAKTFVPGVENLLALVQVSLKQKKRGQLPDVIASLQLERPDDTPISEFSISMLELALDRIELGLAWYREEREWDYSVIVDGTIGFTGAADLIPDLEGLRTPSIEVIGLDLRKMNLRAITIPIKLKKPVRFEIFNGQFAIELGDLVLGWEFVDGLPRPTLLSCKLARFEYLNPGSMEVKITVGGLDIEFDPNLKARIKMPSRLGIEVTMGPGAKLAGEVGWVDTERLDVGTVVTNVERYFFASVTCEMGGFEFKGLLKWGEGKKENGKWHENIVLYGAMGMDYPLFSGVVVKELGGGIGVNNRLTAIPPVPTADAIIDRIDTIKPEKIDSWAFVREDGNYLSVIVKTFLASNQGKPDVIQSYVAMLVFSFDTNLDLVAAGKLWLSASMKGIKSNLDRPALVGAMTFSPRQKKLEVVVESRPNPFVEKNELLEKLFSKARIRFSFRMMPGLVDYFLEEVSYRDEMFGVQLQYMGSYRFAIFDRSVLLRSDLAATGRVGQKLNAGPGGFDFGGHVSLAVGYGGLLSLNGAMAYAYLDASAAFRLSAWIEIHFSISIKCCGKRWTKRWSITFSGRAGSLELTIRGNIGLNDHAAGLIGVDTMIGINFPICGYRLKASGRWDVRGEIYDDVRTSVAAFESRLNEAIKPSSSENSFRSLTHRPAPVAPLQKRLAAASKPASLINSTSETWLRYKRTEDDLHFFLLLPKSDELWLAPKRAEVTQVDFVPQRRKEARGQLHVVAGLNTLRAGAINPYFNVPASPRFQPTSVHKLSDSRWRIRDDRRGQSRFIENKRNGILSESESLVEAVAPSHGLELHLATVTSTSALVDALDAEPFVVGDIDPITSALDELGYGSDTKSRTILETGKRWHLKTESVTHARRRTFKIVNELGEIKISLVRPVQIGLAGVRSTDNPQNALKYNRVGELKRVDTDPDDRTKDKFVLDTEIGSATKVDSISASWYEFHPELNETLGEESADLQQVPQLIHDVDRIVVATDSEWVPIENIEADTADTLKLTISRLSDAALGSRLLVRRGVDVNGNSIVHDCGWSRLKPEGRFVDCTLHVRGKFVDPDDGVEKYRVTLPAEYPQVDWEVVPAKEIASFWNPLNRAAAIADGKISANEFADLVDDSAMIVESAISASEQIEFAPGYASYRVVADPRYESTDRHWMPLQDQFLLPDDILSTRFRPIEETLDDATSEELRQIREYDQARQQLRRNEMHGAADPEPAEESQQIRARVAQAIIDDLSDEAGVQMFGEKFVLTGPGNTNSQLVMGLGFQLEGIDALEEVYVRRTGGQLRRVEMKAPDDEKQGRLTDQIKRLPIRQEFLVDNQPQNEREIEKGRIAVKLPLQFTESLLRGVSEDAAVSPLGLERLGRIQILRKLPWEETPTILRDHVRPDINVVQQTAAETRIFDDLTNLSPGAPLDKLEVASTSRVNSRHVGFFVEVQGAEQNLVRIKSVAVGAAITEIWLHGRVPDGSTVFSIVAAGALVQTPYVFTDEFVVEDRQLVDPDLVASGLLPEQIHIQYSLRVVPHGEPSETIDKIQEQRDLGRYADWDSVPLHIPAPDLFPRRLGLAIGVLDLANPDRDFLFQLVSLTGENPSPAMLGDRSLDVDDFEIWATERPLEQTGFYAGDDATRATTRPVDNSTVSLADVRDEVEIESCLGKFRVPVFAADGAFRIPASTFQTGTAYELFIGPSGDFDCRLRRLQHLMVRELPSHWSGAVRFRQDEQLELVPKQDFDDVVQRRVDLLHHERFSADDLFLDGGNAIRSLWNTPSLQDGGAEIVFRDFDDSGFVERQLCEVIEEDRYRELRSDFGNASYWRLTRSQRRERLASRLATPASRAPISEDELLPFFFFGHQDFANHPIIKDMVYWYDKVSALAASGDWRKLARAASGFAASLLNFRKSPLNLHLPEVEQTIDALLRTLRVAFIGLKVPAVDSDKPLEYTTALRTMETGLRDLLQRAEQSAPGDMAADEDGQALFLDRDTARRLAGIVRRRIAIADDAVSLIIEEQESGSLNLALDASTGDFELPRQAHWDKTRTETLSFFPESSTRRERLPLTHEFADAIDKGNYAIAQAAIDSWFDVLQKAVGFEDYEECAGLPPAQERACKLEVDRGNDDAKARMAEVLPRATGLVQFLRRLESELEARGRQLIKRPHHSLTITSAETGEISAQDNSLHQYLPDSARGDADDALPPLPSPAFTQMPILVSRLASISSNGMAQIWTVDGGDPALDRFHKLHEFDVAAENDYTGTHVELDSYEDEQYLLTCHRNADDSDTSITAQLFDVLTGQRIRRLAMRSVHSPTYKTYAATFAHTKRGLQAITAGHTTDAIAELDWTLVNILRFWDASLAVPTATFRRRLSVFLHASSNPIVFAHGSNTITRVPNPLKPVREPWVADGFAVGDLISVKNARKPANNKTYRVQAISRNVLTVQHINGSTVSFQNDPPEEDRQAEITVRPTAKFSSVAYSESSRMVAAGTDDGKLVAWNDIGQSGQLSRTYRDALGKTIFELQVDAPDTPVDHLIFVDAPEGTRVVAGTRSSIVVFDLESGRRTHSFGLHAGSGPVSSLAMDGVNLRLFAGYNDGSVSSWEWNKSTANSVLRPNVAGASEVSIFRSRDTSYLAVGYPTASDIEIWDVRDGSDGQPAQRLPNTGNAGAITTGLMPAVSSSTAMSVNALVHLWERMGFAIDFALVDERNQLMKPRELERIAKDVAQQIKNPESNDPPWPPVTNEEHRILFLDPLEPDSDYQPDNKVGFSFKTVAVLPERFHDLCLHTEPDLICKATLKNTRNTGQLLEGSDPSDREIELDKETHSINIGMVIAVSWDGSRSVVSVTNVNRKVLTVSRRSGNDFPDVSAGNEPVVELHGNGVLYVDSALPDVPPIRSIDERPGRVEFDKGAESIGPHKLTRASGRWDPGVYQRGRRVGIEPAAGEPNYGTYRIESVVSDTELLVTSDEDQDVASGTLSNPLIRVWTVRLLVLSGPGAGISGVVTKHWPGVFDSQNPQRLKFEGGQVWSELPEADTPEDSIVAFVSADAYQRYADLIEWFKYRSLKHPTDADGNVSARTIIELLHLREMARYVGDPVPDKRIGQLGSKVAGDPVVEQERNDAVSELAVEPQVERWLTVPAVGGWSHSAWTVPDRKGHRFEIAIRRVSRYEPLIRWAIKDHRPVEVPADTVVLEGTAAATDGRTYLDFGKDDDGQPKLLPESVLDRHPLFVEIARGSGAGQRRELISNSRSIAQIDPTDPWLVEVKGAGATNESHYRVIAHGDNWQLLDLPPSHDPHSDEGNKTITVYQYPHPRRIQFSYQIPLQGARSIYNQISQVRTGYRGTDHSFRYLILDRAKDDPQRLARLLERLALVNDDLPDPKSRMKTRAPNKETRIRLLRHERLMSLPDLPFYYRYRMDVRALFESRPQERDRLFESDVLPADPNLSPLAERQPSRLRIHQPKIQLSQRARIDAGDCMDPDAGTDGFKFVKLQLSTAIPDLERYLAGRNAAGLRVQLQLTRPDGHVLRRDIKPWKSGSLTQVVELHRSLKATGRVDQEGGLAIGQRTVRVRGAERFIEHGVNFFIKIDEEELQVMAIDPDTNQFTVDRAQRGTTPANHADGADILLEDPPDANWDYVLAIHLYDVELYQAANDDHLALEEKRSEPEKLRAKINPVSGSSLDVNAGRLPDFAIDYGLFAQVPMGTASPGQTEPFKLAGNLALPWATKFQPEDHQPRTVPIITVSEGLAVYSSAPFLLESPREPVASVELYKMLATLVGRKEDSDTEDHFEDVLDKALSVRIEVLNYDPADVTSPADRHRWQATRTDTSAADEELQITNSFASTDFELKTIKLELKHTAVELRISITDAGGAVGIRSPRKLSVGIEAVRPSTTPSSDLETIAYRVKFTLGVSASGFNEPGRYFLQGFRDGDCTKSIQFENIT